MTPASAARTAAMPSLGEGYEAIALLSRGNEFDVVDAWSSERGSRVIVKTVRPDRAPDTRKEALLRREGELLARLTHPHIVRGYETREGPAGPIVVMETLGGQALSHMLEFDGLLEDAEAAQLGLQLGSAVRYLHSRGFLHLDLKPSNVIAENGRAKLVDLGLAAPSGPVKAGVGTWCYMAPEQARGGTVGPEADVWGLGATIYESVSGWPPFDDPEREIGGLMDEDIEYPQLERQALPLGAVSKAGAALAEAVDACLRIDPGGRPQLTEVLGLLEEIADVPIAERRWR